MPLPAGLTLHDPAQAALNSALPEGLTLHDPAQQASPAEPETGFLTYAEPALTVASAMVAEPLAGVLGIMQGVSGLDGSAGGMVDFARDAMTYQPRSDQGKAGLQGLGESMQGVGEKIQGAEEYLGGAAFDATGSPMIAAAAATIPTAAMEILGFGLGKVLKKGGQVGKAKIIKKFGAMSDEAAEASRIFAQEADEILRPEAVDATVRKVKSMNPDQISKMIDADPAFYQAAEQLGLSVEPLASYASRNPQYRAIEGALRSVPGSVLDSQEKLFIQGVTRKADDLIQQYGGTTDKAGLSQEFLTNSRGVIDDLYRSENALFDTMRKVVPYKQAVVPENLTDFLNEQVVNFGGVDELPALLKDLHKKLMPKEVDGEMRPPTFGQFDYMRREVGDAIGKKSGAFKDAEVGQLKHVYSKMAEDGRLIAENGGMLKEYDAGMRITGQRKQIEDNMKFLLGKDLTKDLSSVVGGALRGLSSAGPNGAQKLKDTYRRIAEIKDLGGNLDPQAIMMSAFNDVFRGTGAGKQALDVTQFAKFMDNVNRSPEVKKVLTSMLPPEAMARIDALGRISKGVSESMGDKITTGRIMSIFDETGVISKVMGAVGKPFATAGGYMVGQPQLGSVVADFIAGKGKATARAAEMMSDPTFLNLVRQSAAAGVFEGGQATRAVRAAEKKLMQSAKYARWARQAEKFPGLSDEQFILLSTSFIDFLKHGQQAPAPQQELQQ